MASIGGGQQPNKEEKLLLSLHKERSWSSPYVYLFQEFWCLSTVILVTSLPKSDKLVSRLPDSSEVGIRNETGSHMIFVGNLDPNVTDDHLRQVFSQYGELVHVKIPAGIF
ncbi:hypothetical protein JHK87_043389 [Glycine soja]|nr:hypothetical protein JHK87_043389 [Glycine soja]